MGELEAVLLKEAQYATSILNDPVLLLYELSDDSYGELWYQMATFKQAMTTNYTATSLQSARNISSLSRHMTPRAMKASDPMR